MKTILVDMLQSLTQLSKLCLLSIILLPYAYSDADYRYTDCLPTNCSRGPNISFPFYIDEQQSFCGYPGFKLSCGQRGFPILELPDNVYVVEDIFYQTRTLRVYDADVISLNGSGCFSRLKNASLPTGQFGLVDNVTDLHFFSNCSGNSSFSRDRVVCDGNGGGDWDLALYGKDGNLTVAMENCQWNIIVPVEDQQTGDGRMGVGDLEQVLRRGFVMNWTASDCDGCEKSGGRCGFNESAYHFMCFCPDRPHSRSCLLTPRKNRLPLILAPAGVVVFLLVTSILIFLILTKRKKINNSLNQKDIELFLKNYGNNAPTRYRYSELKKMTYSFTDNLGKGGYGSVYKGKSQDGRLLAVKVLNDSKNNGEDFMNEIASISRTSHVNIVTLLGFCFGGSKRALVYEFMPNGSLDKFISSSSAEAQLGWEKLFQIAVGIARGLEYQHKGCNMRILHFDIKPHNILLDKDFQPKISDFGLAKLCPGRASIISMSGTRGTIGYIAPEVFCRNFGEVSHKSDVYSYGMMVLEIVGEKRSLDPGVGDHTSEIYFPHWIYKHLELNDDQKDFLDVVAEEDEWLTAKRKLAIVGLWCIQTDPKDRPAMSRVVEMLEGKLESLQIPPKPYLSSPPRPALEPDTSISESETLM